MWTELWPDHPVDDVVFALDVVVDRHRADAEMVGQAADGEGLEADLVGERHRPIDDAVAIEQSPRVRPLLRHPASFPRGVFTNRTKYV